MLGRGCKTVRDYFAHHGGHRSSEGRRDCCIWRRPDVLGAQWQAHRLRSHCPGWISARRNMSLMDEKCQPKWWQRWPGRCWHKAFIFVLCPSLHTAPPALLHANLRDTIESLVAAAGVTKPFDTEVIALNFFQYILFSVYLMRTHLLHCHI